MTLKPKIGLVGFERFQGEIFAENGLAVSGHIFTGKDNGTEANATRNISFERFKKFDYPGQPETSSESDLLAFGTSQQSAEAFEYFVRCVERWDWSKELVHDWTDYRHLFAKALANANAWLEATKPEVLVFSNVPHQGALIALFYLARQKGIRTVIFLQSHFPGRSWAFEHWDDIGKSKTLLNEETFEIDISPPDAPPFYMKSVRSDLKRNIRAIASEARARFVVFSGLTGLTSTSRRQTRNRNLGRIKKEAENRHYYQTANTFFSKKLDAVSAGGFVYFPLHLQPEMTTDVLGGAYADQALALETLRKIVPAEISIAVKENPKQRSQMRGDAFFERLSAIENLVPLARDVSSFEAISASSAVATITGTAGWEALRMQKPVLCFGNAYWRELPGVFHIENTPDWREVSSFKFDKNKLQKAADKLSQSTWAGDVDKLYSLAQGSVDSVENARKLARSIHQLIGAVK